MFAFVFLHFRVSVSDSCRCWEVLCILSVCWCFAGLYFWCGCQTIWLTVCMLSNLCFKYIIIFYIFLVSRICWSLYVDWSARKIARFCINTRVRVWSVDATSSVGLNVSVSDNCMFWEVICVCDCTHWTQPCPVSISRGLLCCEHVGALQDCVFYVVVNK